MLLAQAVGLGAQVRGLLAHLVVEAAGRLGRGDVILEGMAQGFERVDDLGLPRRAVAMGEESASSNATRASRSSRRRRAATSSAGVGWGSLVIAVASG